MTIYDVFSYYAISSNCLALSNFFGDIFNIYNLQVYP